MKKHKHIPFLKTSVRQLLIISLLSFTIFLKPSFGQESIIDYSKGIKVKSNKESIYLFLNTSGEIPKLNYFICCGSREKLNKKSLPSHAEFHLTDDTEVYMRWLNPLRYNVDKDISETADPLSMLTDEFLATLTASLQSTKSLEALLLEDEKGESDSLAVVSLFSLALDPDDPYDARIITISEMPKFSDLLLRLWRREMIDEKQLLKDSVIILIDNLLVLESTLEEGVARKNSTLNKSLFKLSNPSEIIGLTGGFKASKNEVERLGSVIKEIKKLIKSVADFDYSLVHEGEYFQKISKDVALHFLIKASATLGLMNSSLQQLTESIKKLELSIGKTADGRREIGGEVYVNLQNLSISRDKKHDVKLKISELIKDNEGSKSTKPILEQTITFRRFRKFIPFVSTGAFFSDIQLNSFGTETNGQGATVVAEIDNSKETAYAIMLNYALNVKNSDLLPLIQLGIDPTKERPFLLFGAGISFLDLNLAISAGLAWTWKQQLNTLSIGDVVDGTAAIQQDLIFRFQNTPKPYFGIQFKF